MDKPAPRSSEDFISPGGEVIFVLITTGSRAEADTIARRLVEERLAACVNIISQVRSLFSWEQKLSEEDEALLIVKSRRPLFCRLADRVRSLHSYTVPEIIALPVLEGSAAYLKWIGEVTG